VKILVVAPAWVGDMVMAHTLVSLLVRRSEAAVYMVAPPATEPLARRMPGVQGSWALAVGHGELGIGPRRALARTLKAERFDQAIVLPNSFKSALLPYWAGIPRRTGWQGESRYLLLNDRRRLDPGCYPLMIERFMALALPEGAPLPEPYPLPRLAVDPASATGLAERLGLDTANVTALCPGAEFGPAKRWPPKHFAALARAEVERGRNVWLLGSPGDRSTCEEITAATPDGVVNLAGRTTLLEAVDLLSLAERVVANDSGLMHVAAALDRHLVALFGSTSPDFTPPLGERSRVLSNPVDCSPCFQRQCPLGHLQCLEGLGPEQVIEVL
jgi:heptosyltransferase-2